MTQNLFEGVPIREHPLVTWLMKGVYNLKPPNLSLVMQKPGM